MRCALDSSRVPSQKPSVAGPTFGECRNKGMTQMPNKIRSPKRWSGLSFCALSIVLALTLLVPFVAIWISPPVPPIDVPNAPDMRESCLTYVLQARSNSGESIFLGADARKSVLRSVLVKSSNEVDMRTLVAEYVDREQEQLEELLGVPDAEWTRIASTVRTDVEPRNTRLGTSFQASTLRSNTRLVLDQGPAKLLRATDGILLVRISKLVRSRWQDSAGVVRRMRTMATPNADRPSDTEVWFVQLRLDMLPIGPEYMEYTAAENHGLVGTQTAGVAVVLSGFALTIAALLLERRGRNLLQQSSSDQHLYRASIALMTMTCVLSLLVAVGSLVTSGASPASLNATQLSLALSLALCIAVAIFFYAFYLMLLAGNINEEIAAGRYVLHLGLFGCTMYASYWLYAVNSLYMTACTVHIRPWPSLMAFVVCTMLQVRFHYCLLQFETYYCSASESRFRKLDWREKHAHRLIVLEAVKALIQRLPQEKRGRKFETCTHRLRVEPNPFWKGGCCTAGSVGDSFQNSVTVGHRRLATRRYIVVLLLGAVATFAMLFAGDRSIESSAIVGVSLALNAGVICLALWYGLLARLNRTVLEHLGVRNSFGWSAYEERQCSEDSVSLNSNELDRHLRYFVSFANVYIWRLKIYLRQLTQVMLAMLFFGACGWVLPAIEDMLAGWDGIAFTVRGGVELGLAAYSGQLLVAFLAVLYVTAIGGLLGGTMLTIGQRDSGCELAWADRIGEASTQDADGTHELVVVAWHNCDADVLDEYFVLMTCGESYGGRSMTSVFERESNLARGTHRTYARGGSARFLHWMRKLLNGDVGGNRRGGEGMSFRRGRIDTVEAAEGEYLLGCKSEQTDDEYLRSLRAFISQTDAWLPVAIVCMDAVDERGFVPISETFEANDDIRMMIRSRYFEYEYIVFRVRRGLFKACRIVYVDEDANMLYSSESIRMPTNDAGKLA